MPDRSVHPKRSRDDMATAAGFFSFILWGAITETIGGLSTSFRFFGALAVALVALVVVPVVVAAFSRSEGQT